MSNGWNSELNDLPGPDSVEANDIHSKEWNFNAQLLHRLASSLLKRIHIVALLTVGVLSGLTRLASKLSRRMKSGITIVTLVAATVLAGHTVSAQLVVPPLPPLKNVSVPEPDNLRDFVKDKVAAIALGKSLFWDMQVGSDGIMSCASCHFHAGADSRAKNQLSPGLLQVTADRQKAPDIVVDRGLNYMLKPEDYPFHKLADPNNRSSAVLTDTNDVTSSQGVFNSEFVDVIPGSVQDVVNYKPDPDGFQVGSTNVRRVEPRNTPTVINAVFNFRNFWDGRAQDDFNGVNSFGSRDPDAKVYKARNPSKLEEVKVSLENSSLASVAVAPPLSSFEMSSNGRTFEEIGDKFGLRDKKTYSAGKGKKLQRKLGKKIIPLRPLGKQIVHPNDSVLGTDSRLPEAGLKTPTYEKLIEAAFKNDWWKSNRVIQIGADGSRFVVKKPDRSLSTQEYTLMEYNFPLFFGLGVQMYLSTLVANDTPFDSFLAGNSSSLSNQQKQGFEIFQSKGKCINCHGGTELTNASVASVQEESLDRMEGEAAVYDNGFNNTGVTPTLADLGIGGVDPFGNPLSLSRLAQKGLFTDPNLEPPFSPNEPVVADGGFKVPGLRNVELTAPYFHNGGQLTLRQVVDFYNRGGDFNQLPDLDPDIQPLGLTEDEKEALVVFLKGLTDERVRYEKAPFDHPQLFVTNGHPGDTTSVTPDSTGKATDALLEIPAVGRNGLSIPLPNFPLPSTP